MDPHNLSLGRDAGEVALSDLEKEVRGGDVQMWIPALMGQADEQQQQKWLPPSQRLELIGTYAQTELGHGTFVRGLETTATYDVDRQQFVIHSPTLSSTKWWPGGELLHLPHLSRCMASH